jgi:primosomal protein N' (replication factor Y)
MELAARQRFHYPPFGSIIRIIVRSPQQRAAQGFAVELARFLDERWPAGAHRLVGPAACPMAKLQGKYRFHLLLMTQQDLGVLQDLVRQAQQELPVPESVQWIADVNPVDML